ncbi:MULTISPECIES: hypothetical protein [unclassified Novosphingobium]|uniref:hypothetical protein n=1 Tax=unclassified Novosphingobium TaxID=2644732 RepID=UPI001494D393|nr:MULTISPECIES: hypothetical protein [unclassified Novosphingobium]MBB3358243.1 hypothetical protein [Novosphingobium sp. BK256]MBB3374604.1 hypothetical protein [Novosphingobium sp. BK280]MBB3379016.1 hypothetical protein [Novosphingobium sp. BK258]MBB3420710.1 hypothetical protein [Novosphingobium sp. BK267]MBB3448168.1 hypothetical protein [Novosphingobium sp. BK352]
MIAFHGDPLVKAQALDRLQGHVAAGSFVYFPAWENGNANVIGAVVEADDTPAYAERLGYPLALAETLPMLVNGFRPQPEAVRFALAWLERTPVGADLTTIVSQLVLDLLANADLVKLTERYPDVEQSRQAIMALHRRAIDGDEPDRKTWKAARLAAVAATDAVDEAALERRAAQVVEAAAWPGTMRTVLRDTLNGLGTAELHLSLSEAGWTEENESRVFHIRQQAETDGYKAELSGLDRVLAILDADHPALAEQFRVRLDLMEESSARYRALAWKAIELMEQAPIAATRLAAQ